MRKLDTLEKITKGLGLLLICIACVGLLITIPMFIFKLLKLVINDFAGIAIASVILYLAGVVIYKMND